MQRADSNFVIRSHAARVVEAIGCGVIIGAIAGTLLGVFIIGDASRPGVRYFILGGGIVGGAATFVGGLIRDIHKIKNCLSERMKELKEEEKISLLSEVLEKELIPIKVWAIKELEKIGNEKAIPELKKALNYNSYYIRRKAIKTIKKLGIGT